MHLSYFERSFLPFRSSFWEQDVMNLLGTSSPGPKQMQLQRLVVGLGSNPKCNNIVFMGKLQLVGKLGSVVLVRYKIKEHCKKISQFWRKGFHLLDLIFNNL